MTTLWDNRNSYRVKVRIDIECCKANEYSYNDIVETERCFTSKLDYVDLKTRVKRLNETVLDDAFAGIDEHKSFLDEIEAKRKAMEEAGESC